MVDLTTPGQGPATEGVVTNPAPFLDIIRAAPAREAERLARDARSFWTIGQKGTARVCAAYAGAQAREAGLAAAPCPLEDVAELAADWRKGHAKGLDAPIPRARVLPFAWAPQPGTTHAALSAERET
jgi:hypothetical protein